MLKQTGEKTAEGTWSSPAAERNKGPILDVLARVLPRRGLVLEIASGTGQHVVHFANALPELTWQPSDPDAELRKSIALRIREAQAPNINDPIELDVIQRPWPVPTADAVLAINMIHVAPWSATLALFDGAKALLSPERVLFLYGPYRRFGQHTSDSNAQFDLDLRARNPEWGLRDMATLVLEEMARGEIPVLIARAPEFYGPGKTQSFTNALVTDKLKAGKTPRIPVRDDTRRTLIWTPDASRGLAILGNTTDAYGQTWHLPCCDERPTYRQFVTMTPLRRAVLPMTCVHD